MCIYTHHLFESSKSFLWVLKCFYIWSFFLVLSMCAIYVHVVFKLCTIIIFPLLLQSPKFHFIFSSTFHLLQLIPAISTLSVKFWVGKCVLEARVLWFSSSLHKLENLSINLPWKAINRIPHYLSFIRNGLVSEVDETNRLLVIDYFFQIINPISYVIFLFYEKRSVDLKRELYLSYRFFAI